MNAYSQVLAARSIIEKMRPEKGTTKEGSRDFETFLQILIQLIKIWQHTTNDIYNKDGDKEKDQYVNV